ncbi:MAG: prepilin-type N-terminal cleavage/methylation domain-containing protein [bacterium]|nr:prepilin-type N-terminal cleavage/methylation domain-containing protein [bacterium]
MKGVNKLRQKGFTLIELMIVIAIIGILAAIAIPKFVDLIERSEEGATAGKIGGLKTAITTYYADHDGKWPLSEYPNPGDHPITTQNDEDASELTADLCPTYIARIPSINLRQLSQRPGNGVRYIGPGSVSDDKIVEGHVEEVDGVVWLYHVLTGEVTVNCKHDAGGKPRDGMMTDRYQKDEYKAQYDSKDVGGDGDGKVEYWEYYLQ